MRLQDYGFPMPDLEPGVRALAANFARQHALLSADPGGVDAVAAGINRAREYMKMEAAVVQASADYVKKIGFAADKLTFAKACVNSIPSPGASLYVKHGDKTIDRQMMLSHCRIFSETFTAVEVDDLKAGWPDCELWEPCATKSGGGARRYVSCEPQGVCLTDHYGSGRRGSDGAFMGDGDDARVAATRAECNDALAHRLAAGCVRSGGWLAKSAQRFGDIDRASVLRDASSAVAVSSCMLPPVFMDALELNSHTYRAEYRVRSVLNGKRVNSLHRWEAATPAVKDKLGNVQQAAKDAALSRHAIFDDEVGSLSVKSYMVLKPHADAKWFLQNVDPDGTVVASATFDEATVAGPTADTAATALRVVGLHARGASEDR